MLQFDGMDREFPPCLQVKSIREHARYRSMSEKRRNLATKLIRHHQGTLRRIGDSGGNRVAQPRGGELERIAFGWTKEAGLQRALVALQQEAGRRGLDVRFVRREAPRQEEGVSSGRPAM